MQLFAWLGRVSDLRVFGDSMGMASWLQRLEPFSDSLPVARITAVFAKGLLPPLTDFLASSVVRPDGLLSLRADSLETALVRYRRCLGLLFGDSCELAQAFAVLVRSEALTAWYNLGIRARRGALAREDYLFNVPIGDAESAAQQVLVAFNTALEDWVCMAKTQLAAYHLGVSESQLHGAVADSVNAHDFSGLDGRMGSYVAPSYAHIHLEAFTSFFSRAPSESSASMARLVSGMVATTQLAHAAYGASPLGAGRLLPVAAAPGPQRPRPAAVTSPSLPPPPTPPTAMFKSPAVMHASAARQPRHRGTPIDVSGGLPAEVAEIRQQPLVYHDYKTATRAHPWLTDLQLGGKELCVRHLLFGAKRDGPGGQGCDNGSACPRFHFSAPASL
jgi:hypothetical protein